jgi:ABC-type glycerol-3-phosphate transport system substrate-binding protein
MTRRTLSITLVLAALCVASTWASGEQEGAKPAAGKAPTEIQFWWHGGAAREPHIQKIIADYFVPGNPDIVVKMQSFANWDEMHQKSLLAAASGTSPDCTTLKPMNLPDLADRNQMLALDSLMAKYKVDKKVWFDVQANDSSMWKGKTYALPFWSATATYWANIPLWQAAGLSPSSPPKTWDEMREYAMKMNNPGKQWGLVLFHGVNKIWEYHIQAGGKVVSPDNKQAFMDSPEGRAAFQYYDDLVNKYKVSAKPGEATLEVVYNNMAAIWHVDSGNVANFLMSAPQIDYTSIPAPKGPANSKTVEMGTVLAIFGQSRYPDETFRFINTLAHSTDGQVYFAQKTGLTPAIKAASDDQRLSADKHLAGFLHQLRTDQLWARPIIKNAAMLYRGGDEATSAVLLKKKSIEQALKDWQAVAEKVIAESN